jgi:outer membrane protein OmpA-like peptidoglycan-associated protein
MTTNLIDSAKDMISSESIDRAAADSGAPPDGMTRAMHGAVPTVFAGLTQAVSAPGGAGRIFRLLTEDGGSSPEHMNTAFGDRSSAVAHALGESSGVTSGAASLALSRVLPMVMAVLGRHVTANHTTAEGLSQTLSSQKNDIASDPSTPRGLAGALGLGSLSDLGRGHETREPHERGADVAQAHGTTTRRPAGTRGKGFRWALLVPIVLLGGLLAWGITSLTRTAGRNVGVTAPQPTASVPPTQGAPQAGVATDQTGRLVLPGGQTLDVPQNGPEAQMARTLGDPSATLPHVFAFDSMTFDFGSATLGPDAAASTDDLARMLQSYPSARIRILGHADSSGTEPGNQALSESRANMIKEALVAKGVASDRIEAQGEGDRRPAPGTDSESAANRRAVIVLLSR